MMSLLRGDKEPYELSKFMLKVYDIKSEVIENLKVEKPNKLILFGLFLSLKGFPYLKRYRKDNLNE
jgi:hypothetical protein